MLEEAHDESLAKGGGLDDAPIHCAGSNHRFRASEGSLSALYVPPCLQVSGWHTNRLPFNEDAVSQNDRRQCPQGSQVLHA